MPLEPAIKLVFHFQPFVVSAQAAIRRLTPAALPTLPSRPGPEDISVADAAVSHRPVAEKEWPCIAFAVSDGPINLTGPFRQIIGDLIG